MLLAFNNYLACCESLFQVVVLVVGVVQSAIDRLIGYLVEMAVFWGYMDQGRLFD